MDSMQTQINYPVFACARMCLCEGIVYVGRQVASKHVLALENLETIVRDLRKTVEGE